MLKSTALRYIDVEDDLMSIERLKFKQWSSGSDEADLDTGP